MSDPIIIGIITFVFMLSLSLTGLPIFMTLAITGILGLLYDVGWQSTLGICGTLPFTVLASYSMGVIPLFYVMGDIAGVAGIADDAYASAHKIFTGIKGGLAMSTTIGCAFFGACTGSSIANSGLFTRIALPEMMKYKYDKSFASGCIASAGTLAIMIPPSITFVLYGVITEESIGRLLMAGVIPGILLALFFVGLIWFMCRFYPNIAPETDAKVSLKEKLASLKGIWGVACLFFLIIGGLYAGLFTPTAAGAIGAFGALIIALARKKLNKQTIKQVSLSSSMGITSVMLCLIGGFLLARHLVLSGFVEELIRIVTGGGSLTPMTTLFFICLMYLFLGCVMDPVSMLVVTLPIIYPIIIKLGFNGIWFGVVFVLLTEMALLTPPVGANLYVVVGASGGRVNITDVIKGMLPFLIVLIIFLVIVIAFPQLSLFLPNSMFGK
jgi:C4-dicarboxylate transporter, DctM subunit